MLPTRTHHKRDIKFPLCKRRRRGRQPQRPAQHATVTLMSTGRSSRSVPSHTAKGSSKARRAESGDTTTESPEASSGEGCGKEINQGKHGVVKRPGGTDGAQGGSRK